ncbi:MAG: response regulator [Desulfuromonadaceae bacterium]|nr:response regulator [Desulfuromonadaceae bacterium]
MPDRGKISVLLVEDGSENLNWVEEHLLCLGVDLFWAASGCEAMTLVCENDFGMALLGVSTLNDGIETAAMIHSNPITRHLPIIFVCNGPLELSLPFQVIGHGIVDYLTKPIDPVLLQNKVQLFRELYHQRKAIAQHNEEQIETHQQLQKSRERYIRLLESVTSYLYSVAIHEGEPVATVHGAGCEAVTGFSPEEYDDDPELWFRMIPDEDRPLVLDVAERILKAPSPLTIEHRINHKDGRIHWVRNTLVPHFDLEGRLFSYDGVIIDITERNHAERRLAKSVSLLEATLESTADGILVVDTEGGVASYNRKYLSLWNITEEIAAERNSRIAHELGQLKDPEPLAEKLGYMYSHPEAENSELVELADGRLFEIYSKPQIMGDEIVGRVWSFRDVTERRQLEEQLRQAQKMEAVGRFSGGIAHDFNNILTLIIGYGLQLRESFKEDDPEREYIDQVLAAAERAANLTRSLLVFSRKEVMTPRIVDLNEITRDVEKFLRRMIGEDVQLRTGYTPDRLRVFADSGQLEQVLMNLATNARDAMPDGGSLAIKTEIQELDDEYVQAQGHGEAGDYAYLSVSDNGAGMDAKTLSRIFEPFFTTKDIGKGTGLGLSIVYGIIRQHNGFIDVQSEPGAGTTFNILIPLVKGESQGDSREPVRKPAGGIETILVAEDDPLIRIMVESNLRRYGYEVLMAEDGAAAVEIYLRDSERIDLVLLDMLMPGKSGWNVYEEMKNIRPDVKALFMSGYSPDLLRCKGFCPEEVELLTKPFKTDDLARKVRDILDK